MFIDSKLEKKIRDFVAANYPESAMVTFDTLKRAPGPRMFVVAYDEELNLIKEIEVSEVMEWVNQGTKEKELAVVQSVLIESPEKPKRNGRQRNGHQSNQK